MVRINWILARELDDEFQRMLIDMEYELRSKITSFLIRHLGDRDELDFSQFHFDVDMEEKVVRIAEQTPIQYVTLIAREFENEIGHRCC